MEALFITMFLILSCVSVEVCSQDPLDPADMCLTLVDCGVKDVTPDALSGLTEEQRFRLLPSTEGSTELFVGALQEFLRIDPDCSTDPWIVRSARIESCTDDLDGGLPCTVFAASDPTLFCDNYIRTVEKTSGELLVCGTRNTYTRCYSFPDTCDITDQDAVDAGRLPFNGGTCASEQSYNGFMTHVSARNWAQNSTMAILDNGGQPTLFIGSYQEPSALSDAFIGSVLLGTLGIGGNPFTFSLENSDLDAKHVNRANFVGRPFEYSMRGSDYVLFFFREDATEHINQGKIVYPRVARVCKNDVGLDSGDWGSYLKAQLNCSRPASVPKYYNELEDVFATTVGAETYFYAAFTTPLLAAHESAVCIYTLTEIDDVFQTSAYLAQQTSTSLFTTTTCTSCDADSRPQPGRDCSYSSSLYDSDDRTFIRNSPLMNQTVNNYNYLNPGHESDHPLFYSTGVRFSRIVVCNHGSLAENVIFVGTDSGKIWKIYDGSDGILSDSSIKYWQSTDGAPITGLGLLPDGDDRYLYATTHNKVIQINLQYGVAQTQAQFDTIYPPYLTTGFTASGVICSTAISRTVCNGNYVTLVCKGVFADTSVSADTSWFFTPAAGGTDEMEITATGLGHFIYFNKIRSMDYKPLSYLHINTHTRTSGTYRCVITMGGAVVESQDNTLTVQDCITSTYEARQVTRKNAAVADAAKNKDDYNTANPNYKIEYGTCAACPWN
ncbi:semaphorin-2A-like [Amphiura filiformis]|uniref:semaphorin-2A-like n=1 Tax=Amphiura filiformis TaxID=82378 RepID=UPI003B221A02